MKKKSGLILGAVVLFLLLTGAYFAHSFYQRIYAPNLAIPSGEVFLYLPTGASFETVQEGLAPYLIDTATFLWVSKKKNYPPRVKPGRYRVENGWSNNTLVNRLRAGNQAPIELVLRGIQSVPQLAGFLGKHLEADSLAFLHYLRSREALAKHGLEPSKVLSVFIPNTYEFYWNSSPEFTLKRMVKEADRFWQKRQAKLEKSALSREEVITLASIVESETVKVDEMPVVAGLYLNRLERGMKLESDPTVIYGYKLDFPNETITRVLYRHLGHDSPYNTYQNRGLPPGPIRMPSVAAIDAVLSPANHDYIFMAANPEKPGYHSFARNNAEHNRNAQKYRRWYEEQQRLAREKTGASN